MNRQRPDVRWWIGSVVAHVAIVALLAVVVRHPGMLAWVTGTDPMRADTVTIMWPDDIQQRDGGAAGLQRGQVSIAPLPVAAGVGGVAADLRDTAFAGVDLGQLEGETVPPVSVTPGFGDGRLWRRPGAVARRGMQAGDPVGGVSAPLDAEAHAARIDSVLAQRIVAYLDTLPPDSFAYDMRPPSWTTEIDGRTWGVDQQWIYLGDFKLPTILLGLLPVGGQGNWEESRRAADLQRIREDILRAAARASDAADFRRYVNELRERRDAERRNREQERK